MHLPSIVSAASAELIAICGPDAERAQRLARTYGAAWSTDDSQQVVISPEIDAIVIVTPNDAHAPIAIAAAHAGKHVLCEKPLARSMHLWDDATREWKARKPIDDIEDLFDHQSGVPDRVTCNEGSNRLNILDRLACPDDRNHRASRSFASGWETVSPASA